MVHLVLQRWVNRMALPLLGSARNGTRGGIGNHCFSGGEPHDPITAWLRKRGPFQTLS